MKSGHKSEQRVPIVSIVTPTWNRLELLRECIQSIQEQTFSDWEHIIIDDYSEDGTIEMLEEVAVGDSRIRFAVREGSNKGANVCRNEGLRRSIAPFVVFLDSDDLLSPDCLRRRVDIMQRNLDIDFGVFQMEAFLATPGDLDGKISHDLHNDDLLGFLRFEIPWQTSAPIWRREAIEELGGFDETLPSWQDIDLHFRALCDGRKYLKLPIIDFYMRWQFEETKVSVMQQRSEHHLHAAEELLVKFENLVRTGPTMTWTRQRALCGLYFFLAERWIMKRKLSRGFRCWRNTRRRNLAPVTLFLPGFLLLAFLSVPLGTSLSCRVIHKWKGWSRFRTNPELLKT